MIFILSAAILVSGLVSRYESYSEARAEAAGSLVAGEDLIGATASLKPLGELAVGDTTFIAKLDPATGEVRVFPVGEFDPDWPELAKDFDDSSCGRRWLITSGRPQMLRLRTYLEAAMVGQEKEVT